MPVAGLISAGVGLVGGAISRSNANSQLDKLQKADPTYKENPLAAQRLGLANTLLNARMPGASSAEQNIYTNQANIISRAERGATDSAQMLAVGGNAQGQTNDALTRLGMEEAGDYQRRYGNFVGAQEGLINEQDKVYQDKVRRFQDMSQIQGAKAQNSAASWQELSNFGMGMANFGVASGWKWPGSSGGGTNGGANPNANGGGGYLQNRNFQY